MRGRHESEREFWAELLRLSQVRDVKILQAVFGFVESVKRESRSVFRFLDLVVIGGVFFLQVAGVGQNDAA